MPMPPVPVDIAIGGDGRAPVPKLRAKMPRLVPVTPSLVMVRLLPVTGSTPELRP